MSISPQLPPPSGQCDVSDDDDDGDTVNDDEDVNPKDKDLCRDLDDDGTIRQVAEAVDDPLLLRLLAALTEADSIATGPSAWSTWKASLVRELVERTSHVLGGGDVGDVVARSFPDASQQALLDEGAFTVRGDGDTLTVVAADRPGTFSKVAGVLALNGADVVEEEGQNPARTRVGRRPRGPPPPRAS